MAIQPLLQNEGSTDRALRVVVGLVLLTFAFVGPKSAWGWVGLVPLATGLMGTCPLYMACRVTTGPTRHAD